MIFLGKNNFLMEYFFILTSKTDSKINSGNFKAADMGTKDTDDLDFI